VALYYLGSLLADQVLWLEVGEVDTIDAVSNRKSQFDAAFAIMQWIVAFYILIEAAVAFSGDWRAEGEAPKVSYPHSYTLECHS
jgi:hypothetical protein